MADQPADPTPTLEGAPDPKGAETGASPTPSMEVQVGSPLAPDDDNVGVVAELNVGLQQDSSVTLEASVANVDQGLSIVEPTTTAVTVNIPW